MFLHEWPGQPARQFVETLPIRRDRAPAVPADTAGYQGGVTARPSLHGEPPREPCRGESPQVARMASRYRIMIIFVAGDHTL